MANIILYSTGCPKCKVLSSKLDNAGIAYDICNDKSVMIAKGFTEVPILEIDGNIYDFLEAVNWINNK